MEIKNSHASKKSALILSTLLLAGLGTGISGCGVTSGAVFGSAHAQDSRYLPSGSIILSQKVPPRTTELAAVSETKDPAPVLAPLLGYFPPSASYLPAENETWLEIDRSTNVLLLYKGKEVVKEIRGEGKVEIDAGDYYLQHKQKQPVWYAPDDYFRKRHLALPDAGDRLRFRRGALGRYALYPTNTFAIHSGPVWSTDVGGLRISDSELSSIFYMLPLGAPVVVKE